MQLLHKDAPIKDGALLRDHAGRPWRFVSVVSEASPGRAGKVSVIAGWNSVTGETQARTLYVTVFPALRWSESAAGLTELPEDGAA